MCLLLNNYCMMVLWCVVEAMQSYHAYWMDRGIVDWLFMCLKKERAKGRFVSLISHHSPFGVTAWQLHIVRIRVDWAEWAWGRLLAGVSSVKLSCQRPCSMQLEVWPYLELLPLLLVVDSCQWDKTIRYIWKWTAALTALWPAKMTHLMQPMSVTGTGASGRRQSGWRGWKDPWTCIGEVAGAYQWIPCCNIMWRRVVAR